MSFPLATRKASAADADDEPEPLRSLPEFLRDVRESAEFAAGVRTALSTLTSSLDTTTIFETSQAVFEADVARRRSLKDFIAIQRLRQAERNIDLRCQALELTREKYEFSAAAAVLERLAEIKEIDADRTLAQPEKIQAVRQRLFGAAPTQDLPSLLSEPADENLD